MMRKVLTNSRGINSFILILVGLVLIVAFAVFLNAFSSSRQLQTVSQPSRELLQSISSTPETANNLPEGWKMYRDEELGFSMKLPPEWYFEQNPDFHQPRAIPDALEVRVMFANYPPPFLGLAEQSPQGCRLDLLVAVTSEEPRQLLFAEKPGRKYEEIGGVSSPSSEEEVSVGGTKAIKRVYQPDGRTITEKRTVILLPGADKLWAFYFWSSPEFTSACDGVFDMMVSSFAVDQ